MTKKVKLAEAKDLLNRLGLMGVKETGDFLGWDKRKVSAYYSRGLLPEPVIKLASGPIWIKKQLKKYMRGGYGTYYTTWGPRRGGCGHLHQTLDAAERCLQQDHKKQDSDRHIRCVLSRNEMENYDRELGPGKPLQEE